jgi:hypothetical protein
MYCSDCGACEESHGGQECNSCYSEAEVCSEHANLYCADCGNEISSAKCERCRNECEECAGDNDSESVVCRPCFAAANGPTDFPIAVASDDGSAFNIGEMEVNWS